MSLAELQEQNAKLRQELSRLEALAASLDDSLEEKYNFSALTSSSLTDLEEIKEAFDRFDTDSSGFVDKDELAGLAASLGELWDDQELNDAFAAIDISGDKKISLNEFARWWNLSTRSKVQKSNMKLNILRAKLVTKTFRKGIPEMMRRLSEQKVQDDWVNHHVLLDIDSSAQPAAFLHATLKFLPADRSHFTHFSEKTNILIQYLLVPKPGQSDAQRKAAADALIAALNGGARKADEPAYVHIQGPYTVVVLGFHASDPLETARSLGLDLNNFVRGTTLKIEFGKPLTDLFRPDPNTCLAEMLKLKFDLNVSFRKALMYALVEAKLPGAPVALFFSLLEKTEIAFRFGSVQELLAQAQPPEGYDIIEEYKKKQAAQRELQIGAARVAVKAANADMSDADIDALLAQAIDRQQEAELAQLQMMQQGPQFFKPSFYLQKGYQSELKNMYLDLLSGLIGKADQWVSDLITVLKDNFVEVKQLHVRSPGGLDVEVQLQNFFTFDLFPTIVKDENGRFDVKRE